MREIVPEPASRFVDPDRLPRIRDHLATLPVDGLLAFSPANSYYLSGGYAGMYSRPVIALVTPETSLVLTPEIERTKVTRTAWTDRALVYADTDDPFDVLATAIAETNVDVLGYDKASAKPDWVAQFEAACAVTIQETTDAFLDLRAVKTPWEVEMIRRARKLATAGMEAYLDGVERGVTELEVLADVQQAYYETYLEEFPEYDIGTANELGQYGFASVLTSEHALEPHSLSTARVIDSGDSVVGIALPSIQGYVCEEERTVLVGDVPAHIEDAMATLVEVRNETMDRVGPGIGTHEIDEFAAGELRAAGYADQLVHRTGHGEGITIHEGPALNARTQGTLEPGMVISVEPGLYFEDDGLALRHSDTLVVGDDGAERLTPSPDGVLRAE
ncbi:M24 family metallopeptidase [Natronococcus wangiae]|uniref:M24 family metallopeptidase n=1 Tax=Natronococcus wangiae TaxID=3068275 RepID=UPI00273E9A4B|nr:Xaa-Pro peptidase family protein [Natronococcus sp. AD5]